MMSGGFIGLAFIGAAVLSGAQSSVMQDTAGVVALECSVLADGHFDACKILSRPEGEGYVEVALARAGTARVAVPADGAQGATVRFQIVVEAPLPETLRATEDDPRPGLIAQPRWLQAPAPAFPERAAARGIEAGQARVRCVTSADGGLTDCRVLSQSPSGLDFGASVMAAASQARLDPASLQDARPGAVVEISSNFRPAD